MPCTPLASAMTETDGIERVGLAVERQDLLALARLAHDQVAGELLGVEHVQRPVEVEGHQVGDVDQGRDRAQADRLQAALQPVGRGAVPEAAEMAADHDGAGAVGLGLVAVRPLDRTFVAAGDRVGLDRLQRAEARRRQIAGDAVHAQAIGAVGRHLDLDHRIVEAERLGRRRAGRGLGRQVDDAAMVVAQLQLAEGAQHAVALLAADLARLQRHVRARDVAAGRREDALHAGARVGRAAHDLHQAAAGIDPAQPQPVGIGMLHRLDHVADDEALRASRPGW